MDGSRIRGSPSIPPCTCHSGLRLLQVCRCSFRWRGRRVSRRPSGRAWSPGGDSCTLGEKRAKQRIQIWRDEISLRHKWRLFKALWTIQAISNRKPKHLQTKVSVVWIKPGTLWLNVTCLKLSCYHIKTQKCGFHFEIQQHQQQHWCQTEANIL